MRDAPFLAIAIAALMLAPALLVAGEGGQPSGNGQAASVVQLSSAPTDQDGNGKYESLGVMATVNFTQPGDYEVRLSISAEDGGWKLTSSQSATIDGEAPVLRYFIASFEGWKLFRMHVSGAIVAQALIVDNATTATVASAMQRGGTFTYTDFETPTVGATVRAIGNATGLDLDGDLMYEVLVVPIDLRVELNGTYEVVLTGSGGVTDRVEFTYSNTTGLTVGDRTVDVWVPGSDVRSALNLTALVRSGALSSATVAMQVVGLRPREFERPDLSRLFPGGHTESGLDPDRNGLYDQLALDLPLNVTIPGQYSLTAYLAPKGDWVDMNLTCASMTGLVSDVGAGKVARAMWKCDLVVGTATANLVFDGRLIGSWGHAGTYGVLVVARGPASFLWTVLRIRETARFDASAFEHTIAPLELVGGASDAGVTGSTGEGYTALRVTFKVQVRVAGEYTALGVLSSGGKEVAYARTTATMPSGAGELPLLFPGGSIHDASLDGPYTAVVRVQGAGFAWNDTALPRPMTATHETGRYAWAQFEAPASVPGPKEPRSQEGLDTVTVETGTLTSVVARSRPDIAFFVTSDAGRRAYLRLLLTRLVAFTDTNHDGAPQPEEVAYTADLRAYRWEMGDVNVSDDGVLGRVVSFYLTTAVDLVEQDARAEADGRPPVTVDGFARITLHFTLASNDANLTTDNGIYSVLGGSELKIELSILVLRPVADVDHLAVEQMLRDDRGRFEPRPVEASGVPGGALDVRPFMDVPDPKQLVDFTGEGRTPGFYSWVNRADLSQRDGTESESIVRAGYTLSDDVMTLYLSYPYDVETAAISHDPSLGIFGDGLPPLAPAWRAAFDPVLWTVGAVVAAAAVLGLRGKRGKGDEEEDLSEEEGPLQRGPGGNGPGILQSPMSQHHDDITWEP